MTRASLRHTMNHRDLLVSLRAATGIVLQKNMFLKNSQISQGNTCVGVSFSQRFRQKFHLRKTASICFTSKYYNKQLWRVWTRRDLDRMQSIFLKRTETVARRCSVKKVFLEILQNSPENTCARVSFKIKLQDISDVLVAASERNNFIQSNAAKIKKVSLTFQLTFLLFISKSKKGLFCTLFKF